MAAVLYSMFPLYMDCHIKLLVARILVENLGCLNLRKVGPQVNREVEDDFDLWSHFVQAENFLLHYVAQLSLPQTFV